MNTSWKGRFKFSISRSAKRASPLCWEWMATRLDRGLHPPDGNPSIGRSSGSHWQTAAHSQTCCCVGFGTRSGVSNCRQGRLQGPLSHCMVLQSLGAPLSEPSVRRSTPARLNSFRVSSRRDARRLCPTAVKRFTIDCTRSRWWRFWRARFYGRNSVASFAHASPHARLRSALQRRPQTR